MLHFNHIHHTIFFFGGNNHRYVLTSHMPFPLVLQIKNIKGNPSLHHKEEEEEEEKPMTKA